MDGKRKGPGRPQAGAPQHKRKLNDGPGAAPQPSPKKAKFSGKPKPAGGKEQGGKRPPPPAKTTAEKNARVREKKLAHKKNWDIIQDSVTLWEKLRPKETPDEERKQLVSNILRKVKGKLLELSNHHTASRVIQFCVQYGTPEERRLVMDEVRSNIVELSRSKYGHFLVRKMINKATKEEVPGLVRLFRGHVAPLLRQPYGSDVIMDLYDVASTAQRNEMAAEFYGKEFALFDGVAGEAGRLSSLKQLMEGVAPAKRRAIVLHMSKVLAPIMEKAILHPPLTHRLVRDFLECAPSLSVEDAVDTLSQTGTAVLKMVHTHEGAAAACLVLAYGSPRDRKRLLKAMKGHVGSMAVNEWGHVVLCMALSVTDDTALLAKTVVPEIKELLAEGLSDPHVGRVLLALLAPDCRRHFPPAIHAMLHPPQRTVRGSTGNAVSSIDGEEDDDVEGAAGFDGGDEGGGDDGDELFKPKGKGAKQQKQKQQGGKQQQEGAKHKRGRAEDEEGDDDGGGGEDGDGEDAEDAGGERILGHSKKDPALRRREILGAGGGAKSLAAALARACAAQAAALVRSAHSCELVVEVARGGDGGLLCELDPAGVSAVHAALVAEAAQDPDEAAAGDAAGRGAGEDDGDDGGAGPSSSSHQPHDEHVLVQWYSSRALRRLVLCAADEGAPGSGAPAFVQALWDGALAGRVKRYVGGHADKVLAALLRCGVPAVQAAAAKELKGCVKEPLEGWAERLLGGGHRGGGRGVQAAGVKGGAKAAGAAAAAAGVAGGAARGAGTGGGGVQAAAKAKSRAGGAAPAAPAAAAAAPAQQQQQQQQKPQKKAKK